MLYFLESFQNTNPESPYINWISISTAKIVLGTDKQK